jgi:hypothetical protein
MVGKAGSSQIAIVLPRAVSAEKLAEGSRLVLSHNASGESFVSALYLGDLGLSLHYESSQARMAVPETAKLVPIAEARASK